jgi:sulfate permease, SulP family
MMAITNLIQFNNPRGDIFSDVTAVPVSLPLALAFGVASGVGPLGGLYGAVCVGFFAALFGDIPLVSEPSKSRTVSCLQILAHRCGRGEAPHSSSK